MSRRTRASLALIFALVFASAAARRAGAACVPFDQPPAVSSAAFGAVALEAADVDRDGDLDLVTASPEPGVATIWFRNDGDGATWAPLTDPELAGGQDAALAADLDGDGDVDLVSQSADDNFVAWYANDGSAAGWSVNTIVAGSYATGAWFSAPADVDGDGDLDVGAALPGDDAGQSIHAGGLRRRVESQSHHQDVGTLFGTPLTIKKRGMSRIETDRGSSPWQANEFW